MKKLIVLPTILILVAGLSFAQDDESASDVPEIEKIDLEVYAGFPVHWTNAKHDNSFYWFNPDYIMEDKTMTANTAIGLSLTYNFTKKIGMNGDLDFFYGAKMAGFSNPSSDQVSLFGVNLNLGAVFYLYNSNSLRIPLTVGTHLYFYSDDVWMPDLVGEGIYGSTIAASSGFWANRYDLQVGPVISLGMQYHFNESIYFFTRTNVSVDFFRWHRISYIDATRTDQTNTDIEFVVSWGVKPSLGLGIKF
jgi:hypothetical protein